MFISYNILYDKCSIKTFGDFKIKMRPLKYGYFLTFAATEMVSFQYPNTRCMGKPDIFSESLDSSEQNQHRCILFFFIRKILG